MTKDDSMMGNGKMKVTTEIEEHISYIIANEMTPAGGPKKL